MVERKHLRLPLLVSGRGFPADGIPVGALDVFEVVGAVGVVDFDVFFENDEWVAHEEMCHVLRHEFVQPRVGDLFLQGLVRLRGRAWVYARGREFAWACAREFAWAWVRECECRSTRALELTYVYLSMSASVCLLEYETNGATTAVERVCGPCPSGYTTQVRHNPVHRVEARQCRQT